MSSSRVGSVFLGDIQRHRNLASPQHSTPPSSPPPPITFASGSENPASSLALNIDVDTMNDNGESTSTSRGAAQATSIDPLVALELRLRWLEAIIVGPKDRKGKSREHQSTSSVSAGLSQGETLVRLTEGVQRRLGKVMEGNDGVKRFVDKYDRHAHLLSPAFALSGLISEAPNYKQLSVDEIDALLLEMEPDIRAADRDLQEINELEKKGVTGPGKLPDYEALDPRLKKVADAYQEDALMVESLERRISTLMKRHSTYVDALSELFVAWDDTLTEAEEKVTILERDKTEKARLGLE